MASEVQKFEPTGDDALDHYLGIKRPGYALMITGAWGAGKTHFVKSVIKGKALWYVSLFGLQSTEEIHPRVIAAIDPELDKFKQGLAALNDFAGKAGGIVAGASGVTNALLQKSFRSEIKPDEGVLVFDDLERSEIKAETLLGSLNQYVEHLGMSVLIVAHDGKLSADLREHQSKVIGRTIRIKPDAKAVYQKTISDTALSEGARAYFKTNEQAMLDLFTTSESEDLRILRHVINDAARLYDVIPDDLLDSSEGVAHVLALLTAFNIEVREGRMSAEELRRDGNVTWARRVARHTNNEDYKASAYDLASDRYAQIDLESSALSDLTLRSAILDGRYPEEIIDRDLRSSPLFTSPDLMPGPVAFSCRSAFSFKRPFSRRRPGFSSRERNAFVGGYRSR